jgi:hypothetical protein
MPRIRRHGLPSNLFDHLVARVGQRKISLDQLKLLEAWLKLSIIVPEGKWFKRFPELMVCGEGELIKTVLRPGQVPAGEEVF